VQSHELALGLGVCLTVIPVALRERPLQRRVLTRKDRIGTQAVAEMQTPLKLPRLVYEVQVVGTVSGCRVAQEPTMGERRIERRGYW